MALPNGRTLWLLINHFKSKGYGSPKGSDARRLAQARRAREIYEARVAAERESQRMPDDRTADAARLGAPDVRAAV